MENTTLLSEEGKRTAEPEPEWLPVWAYEPKTSDLKKEYLTAGPAVRWGLLSTAVLWGSFIVFPFLVYSFSECRPSGLAPPPTWLEFTYYPIIFVTLYIEWNCLYYLLRPQYNSYGAFKVMDRELPFRLWVVMNFVMSFFNHMDVFSTNLVYASLIKVVVAPCEQADGKHWSVGGIWAKTIDDSLLRSVPFFRDLEVVLFAGWLMILFQGVWMFVRTLPRNPCSLDYSVYYEEPGQTNIKKFKTLIGEDISFRTAIKQLADLNRMATVVANDVTNINTTMKTAQWKADAQLLELRRVVWRFFFRNLLENSFLLNVQVSAFMITRALKGREGQEQLILASLVFKFPPLVFPLWVETQKVYKIWSILDGRGHEQKASNASPEEQSKANRYAFLYAILIVLYCAINGYAAVKLAMSLFVCPESMWNLTGCVSLDD